MIKKKFNMGLFKKNGPKTHNNSIIANKVVNITEDNDNISNIDYTNCILVIDNCLNVKFNNCGFFNCVINKKVVAFIEYKRCMFKDQIITQGYYEWCRISDCTIKNGQFDYSWITQCNITNGIIFASSVKFSTSQIQLSETNTAVYVRYSDFGYEAKREGFIDNQSCLYGYKKAVSQGGKEVIVELLIPEDSFISGGYLKHRTNKAYVNRIYSKDKKTKYKSAHSMFSVPFVYTVGKWVEESKTDTNSTKCCTKGIHFFFREDDAINYCL